MNKQIFLTGLTLILLITIPRIIADFVNTPQISPILENNTTTTLPDRVVMAEFNRIYKPNMI